MSNFREDTSFQWKHKFCFIFGTISFCAFLIMNAFYSQDLFNHGSRVFSFQGKELSNQLLIGSNSTDGSVIKEEGCRIPNMFTYGRLVEPYLKRNLKIDCEIRKKNRSTSEWKPALFRDGFNTLAYDKNAYKYYGGENVECEYEEFFRNNDSKKTDNYHAINSVRFGPKIRITNIKQQLFFNDSEFIRVQCRNKLKKNLTPLYKDYFAFVPLKKTVEERCENIEKTTAPPPGISVMIVGLDGLSRLNFYRQMSFSAHYLKHNIKAIEMKGYNKVGDNTFPNFVSMFGGMSVDELKSSCWKSSDEFFDDCLFIWKLYREHGYRTCLMEDCPNIDTFNYLKSGFWKQPTDYYPRPLDLLSETAIGHKKEVNCVVCRGARLTLNFSLSYVFKYSKQFSRKKHFGIFWSNSFTHDYWNLATNGDETVLRFLKNMHFSDNLNNTILVLLSDHGLRWGSFRNTFQGYLEERLPMLWFVLPEWFQKRYRKSLRNLNQNSIKLTTPYDLFETLRDFANLSRIEDEEIERRSNTMGGQQNSLFLPVSRKRTCQQAKIPEQYCACSNDVVQLARDNTEVSKAANALVVHLNKILEKEPKCSKLKLKLVKQAFLQSIRQGCDNVTKINSDNLSNYVISIETTPGNGIFEATTRYENIHDSYEVIGSVSRVNQYGKQSKCINDDILRLYCFCLVE